jgi:hypothetical protein
VDENVFSILAADEAVALSVVEPLHCALFHSVELILLLDLLNRNGKGCCRRSNLRFWSRCLQLFQAPAAYF